MGVSPKQCTSTIYCQVYFSAEEVYIHSKSIFVFIYLFLLICLSAEHNILFHKRTLVRNQFHFKARVR